MYGRSLGLFVTLAAAVATAAAQAPQNPSPQSGSKRRLHDVPTPGVLRGMRTEPFPQIEIDTSGIQPQASRLWDTDPATGAQYRRGEVLVRFRPGTNAAARLRALQAGRGGRIKRTLPGDWTLVELERGVAPAQSLAAFRSRPEVQEVSLNYRVQRRQVRPNDESYSLQWNFDAIGMPAAWQINPGARSDVTVAVIDTGVNTVTDTFLFSTFVGQVVFRFAAAPDLVTDDRIVSPFDFVHEDTLPLDFEGHGTHVAGTVGQQTNNNIGLAGIAYNVKLMPLKVIPGDWDEIINPFYPGGSIFSLAEAIRYAADNGAQVINLSLGFEEPSTIVRDAISYAVSRGAFVAIAAGNAADEGNPTEYPAAYSDIAGAMTVGAVNRDLERAEYSGFHPYVEVCAPGGELRSLVDYDRGVTQVSYDPSATFELFSFNQKLAALEIGLRPRFDAFEPVSYQGTSMATPHVSGIAALLHSQGITKPAAIEEAIKRFARPIDATADECGAGLVDPRRALRGLGLAR